VIEVRLRYVDERGRVGGNKESTNKEKKERKRKANSEYFVDVLFSLWAGPMRRWGTGPKRSILL